jgi:hypothetical protein
MTLLGLSCDELRRSPVARPLVRLLDEAVREVTAAEGTLWLLSHDGAHLLGVFNNGATREVVEQSAVPLETSVIGLVASTGLASCIGPDEWHNPDIDRVTGTQTMAMAAAPIRCHDRVAGVLSAINCRGLTGLFSGNDLETLEWKALLIGLVLEARPTDAQLPG